MSNVFKFDNVAPHYARLKHFKQCSRRYVQVGGGKNLNFELSETQHYAASTPCRNTVISRWQHMTFYLELFTPLDSHLSHYQWPNMAQWIGGGQVVGLQVVALRKVPVLKL